MKYGHEAQWKPFSIKNSYNISEYDLPDAFDRRWDRKPGYFDQSLN